MAGLTRHLNAFSAILTLEDRPTIVAAQVTRRALGPSFQFRHIPELDGFRGAAISLVVLGHFLEFHSASAEVRYVGRNAAQLGVLLFFVLSGFLITGLSVARERKFGKQAGIGLVCPRKRSRNSNACKTCHLALH